MHVHDTWHLLPRIEASAFLIAPSATFGIGNVNVELTAVTFATRAPTVVHTRGPWPRADVLRHARCGTVRAPHVREAPRIVDCPCRPSKFQVGRREILKNFERYLARRFFAHDLAAAIRAVPVRHAGR